MAAVLVVTHSQIPFGDRLSCGILAQIKGVDRKVGSHFFFVVPRTFSDDFFDYNKEKKRIFVPIITKPNNMKRLILTMLVGLSVTAQAQKVLYPRHFDLSEVTLTDGPMKKALDLNCEVLMQYDVDRLLTPFVRQSGLASTSDKTSRYYQWLTKHPNFPNWGSSDFDLSGHVGGHYVSALALAYAALIAHTHHMGADRQVQREHLVEIEGLNGGCDAHIVVVVAERKDFVIRLRVVR